MSRFPSVRFLLSCLLTAGTLALATPALAGEPPELPPVAAPVPADATPSLAEAEPLPSAAPVRQTRRAAVLMDLTWNGLAGFGPVGVFHLTPHVTLEGGVGLSGVGVKLGTRARYNFLTSPATPFLGVGFLTGSGTGEQVAELRDTQNQSTLRFRLERSNFLQFTAGFDLTNEGGFTVVATLGYAYLLGGDNVRMVSGTPSEVTRNAMDLAYRSGAVAGVALGYAF